MDDSAEALTLLQSVGGLQTPSWRLDHQSGLALEEFNVDSGKKAQKWSRCLGTAVALSYPPISIDSRCREEHFDPWMVKTGCLGMEGLHPLTDTEQCLC